MAIDISTDLIITLLPRDIITPTITGSYDFGSPAGTYEPGKDFALVDNVSIGKTAELNFSIAFDSVSQQLYNLDKVYIQAVNDPRPDGTANIPGFWLNQNPDPTDISDDGQNALIPNYNASMSSIVFGSTANIKSNSTLTTGISLTLPYFGFWWKSKILPTIRVVAEKDGVVKQSQPLQLGPILLSTAGVLNSGLANGGDIAYNSQAGQKGFYDLISVSSLKENIANTANILDNPAFDLITYKISYQPMVNGTTINLDSSNFTLLNIAGGTIESLSYAAGVLTIVAKQTAPGIIGFRLRVFIPFDATGLNVATVAVNGNWQSQPPVISGFVNQYLFSQKAYGSLSRSVAVDIGGQPPVKKPYIQESIYGTLVGHNINQNVGLINYSCFRPLNTTIVSMIDSQISTYGPDLATNYVFYDQATGNQVGGIIPADSYVTLYGHYDFAGGNDPNLVARAILDGSIIMQPYELAIAGGQKPNLAAITITKDLFAGYTVDYTKLINFQLVWQLDVISQAGFGDLYRSDPKSSYPTNIYSYMALATCYANPAEGYAAVGDLMAAMDSFQLRGSGVDLDLGTSTILQPILVQRFTSTSYLRAYLPLTTTNSNVLYQVSLMDGRPINTITDYSQTYCLWFRWSSQQGSDNAYTHIPSGTKLTVTLPPELLLYIYLADIPYIQIPVPNGPTLNVDITDYSLTGNQLVITTPIDLDFQPDNICIPIKFLTPSVDLITAFLALDFSKPLVYLQDTESLIYGFNTDSLMFKVNVITNQFTLKGAQLDTTGLSVSPSVYQRGAAATYIATVYNQSYGPSSDYCMAITTPTNQYNGAETSNNILPAYITGVNLIDPNTRLYFQVAANVTPEDILVMKSLNQPGVPNLQTYFDTVVVNSWIKYAGQPLPSGVVMMVACVDNVAKNNLVRIDYNVKVDVPAGDNTLYTNDGVFKYFSSGSALEAQSNMVTIANRVAEAIPVVKTPDLQLLSLRNGEEVDFVAYFTLPTDNLIFKTFTLTDVLHPGLTVDQTKTKALVYPNTPVPFSLALDVVTNTLTIKVANSPQIAGLLLAVKIVARVTNTTLIAIDPQYQIPLFENKVMLMVNDEPRLTAESTPVLAGFLIPDPVAVPVVKAPDFQQLPLELGTPVVFSLTFDAPAETRIYSHFTLVDLLPPALTLDKDQVRVTVGAGVPIAFNLVFDPVTNMVSIDFVNDRQTAGQKIVVLLPTLLFDLSKLPANNRITNLAGLELNQNSAIYSDSNLVRVAFGDSTRCQAITDLLESTALDQAALSHILNAEGEKLQKAFAMDLSPKQIIGFNDSARSLVESVSRLEMLLRRNLELVDCEDCSDF